MSGLDTLIIDCDEGSSESLILLSVDVKALRYSNLSPLLAYNKNFDFFSFVFFGNSF